MTTHRDGGSRALSRGDLVLDDSGRPWCITDFPYGRENVALCDGMAHNKRQRQAVRLGDVLLITGIPANLMEGREMFQKLFDDLHIGEAMREEVHKRRNRFQADLGRRGK